MAIQIAIIALEEISHLFVFSLRLMRQVYQAFVAMAKKLNKRITIKPSSVAGRDMPPC
jgi:hypothetical protein